MYYDINICIMFCDMYYYTHQLYHLIYRYFHDIKKHIAQKVLSLDKCSELSVIAEATILHLISGHSFLPYCYGFQIPNMIFLEILGQFKDDCIDLCTRKTIIGKCQVSKCQQVSIARQVLEEISFLHQLTILHNDIKADNVILLGEIRTAVKIIFLEKVHYFQIL